MFPTIENGKSCKGARKCHLSVLIFTFQKWQKLQATQRKHVVTFCAKIVHLFLSRELGRVLYNMSDSTMGDTKAGEDMKHIKDQLYQLIIR